MGTNVAANLSFGVYLSEEAVPWRDEYGEPDTSVDPEEWVVHKLFPEIHPSKIEPYKDYLDKKKEALESLGIKIVDVCHRETPEYVIAVKDHVHNAWDELPSRVVTALLTADAVSDKLLDICAKLGIEAAADKIDWWLTCWSDYN